MLCAYPIKNSKIINGTRFWYDHRCGQCMPCRITKRQEWAGRIIMEASLHEHSCFITLTYKEEPENRTLVPGDLTNFIKRLRNELYKHNTKIRYFAVGEYGDRTQRPHYHAIIFGLQATEEAQKIIEKTWSLGFITISELNAERAAYCARYTTKKLTKQDDYPDGRHPEFARMSRNPGLAYGFTDKIIDAIRKYGLVAEGDVTDSDVLQAFGDGTIRYQGRKYPISSYHKEKIKNFLIEETDYSDMTLSEEVKHSRIKSIHQSLKQDMIAQEKYQDEETEARQAKSEARAKKRYDRQKSQI